MSWTVVEIHLDEYITHTHVDILFELYFSLYSKFVWNFVKILNGTLLLLPAHTPLETEIWPHLCAVSEAESICAETISKTESLPSIALSRCLLL